jgi:hypothetical protein
MDIDTDKPKPIDKVFDSIKELTKQLNNDLSDIKDDIAFIKQKLDEKIKDRNIVEQEDKYQILDNNREPTESSSWFW